MLNLEPWLQKAPDVDITFCKLFHITFCNLFHLPIERFPLTYDSSGFKSIINRHLLTVGFS